MIGTGASTVMIVSALSFSAQDPQLFEKIAKETYAANTFACNRDDTRYTYLPMNCPADARWGGGYSTGTEI